MIRRPSLTVVEREVIYYGKLNGKRLQDLADELPCSLGCARKWWRIGRDHGLDGLRRRNRRHSTTGALSHFEPLVAERALYWKQQHPKRGPTRILVDMGKDAALDGLVLPKRTALADFFRQACPELLQKRQPRPTRPPPARHVHQLWQVDGKEAIRLVDGTIATVFEVREPVACVCLGAIAHAVQTSKAWRKLNLREVQADLRQVFTEFGLPMGLQTDREKVYGRPPTEAFPTLFTLWLAGLGIHHCFGRPNQATDQAHVEREHRTLFDWLERPQPLANLQALQVELDEARRMHNYILPSHAGDCHGRPPLEVHPEVLQQLRPYHPSAELALFSLDRVDRFLAKFTWSYKVSQVGQFKILKCTYSIGTTHAGERVDVRFDPEDRHFVFSEAKTGVTIKRCPAKGLNTAAITGLDVPPIQSNEFVQLSFPCWGV
jgi:transposase InsO family protein